MNHQPPTPNQQPTHAPNDIAAALTLSRPRLGGFADPFIWYPEITSTNDVAAELADEGATEGTVVAADMQTAGRGRHGRIWASPAGAGLYVSVVLRPLPDVVPLVTIAAGVAIVDGIAASTGLETALKWPNDVYVSGRKLAGILAEAGTSASGAQHVIVGCGINILSAAYPPDIQHRATSIEAELGRQVDRGLVLAESLAAFSSAYARLRDGRPAEVLDAWRDRARPSLGRPVEWDGSDGVRSGVAEDVDATGALLVRTPGGMERLVSGEVRWL